jgi:hypothetical protein
MHFLNKIKAVFSPLDEGEADGAASVSDYVDWLPKYMLRKSLTELRLDTARPLPNGDDVVGIPDAPAIINRLKVLCGLNPFRLAEPAEGGFVREHANRKLTFSACFEDRDDRSICTLRLSIRA